MSPSKVHCLLNFNVFPTFLLLAVWEGPFLFWHSSELVNKVRWRNEGMVLPVGTRDLKWKEGWFCLWIVLWCQTVLPVLKSMGDAWSCKPAVWSVFSHFLEAFLHRGRFYCVPHRLKHSWHHSLAPKRDSVTQWAFPFFSRFLGLL